MKNIFRLVATLASISAVCAAILAAVNAVTKEQIANIKVQARRNAARLVMPKNVKDVEEVSPAIFVGKNKRGRPMAYAVIGKDPNGYGGDIVLMVGLLKDFTILNYQKLEAAETPGLGSKLTDPEFVKQFKGKIAATDIKVTKDGGDIEVITSATITSRAVCKAVNNARDILRAHLAGSKPAAQKPAAPAPAPAPATAPAASK